MRILDRKEISYTRQHLQNQQFLFIYLPFFLLFVEYQLDVHSSSDQMSLMVIFCDCNDDGHTGRQADVLFVAI